jgi:hypothetical protein
MANAKLYFLPPKGAAWLVYHRHWVRGGCRTRWAFVFDLTGLTAFEAWQKTHFEGNPPFYEVITVQLTPYSIPKEAVVSAGTKQEVGD